MTHLTGISASVAARTARAPRSLSTAPTRRRAAAQPTMFKAVVTPRVTAVGGGGRMSARDRFGLLAKRFISSKAKGVDLRMQYVLSGAGGGSWYVVIKDGAIKVTEGTGPNPHATWRSSAETYEKLDDGDMNATLAFLRGKVKIDGDERKARLYGTLFRDLEDVT